MALIPSDTFAGDVGFGEGFAVTPDDDEVFPPSFLWVGDAGDVAVKFASGDEFTATIAAAPYIFPFLVTMCKSTGTTCTNICRGGNRDA